MAGVAGLMGYARRQTRPKPRTAIDRKWIAPTAGWVSNRALSEPASIDGSGAAVLDNFFPKTTGVALRRGKEIYATLENDTIPVDALFSYKNGTREQLFAANANTIYDVSNILFGRAVLIGDGEDDVFGDGLGNIFGIPSTVGADIATGYTSGDWSVIQFATTGGIYLIGVNGVDPGFIYDGDAFYPLVNGGTTKLAYDTLTTPFTVGEIVSGATASGTVWKVGPDYLLLTGVTGTFSVSETITGDLGGGAKVALAQEIVSPGVDFGAATSADMSFVWSYKNRIWFSQNESLNAYYLDVDSIGGTANIFPMGGVFSNGGALLFGQRWSLESGGDGGLSEQCIFVTTQGEVAIYQGVSPAEAATWSLVGIYRIGAPLGKRAYLRGGGDLAIATTVGLVPLSKAISLDVTALTTASVSYKIADAWSEAIELRGYSDWQAMIWSEQKLAAIAPPNIEGSNSPVIFVSNTETGAWARYTDWQANCMEVYGGELYFGSPNGEIFRANVGGLDDGVPYTGVVVPLFDDMGSGGSAKIGKVARARVRANAQIVDDVQILTDFNVALPPAPDATPLTGTNTWGDGVWGQSDWGATTPNVINQQWRSAGCVGYSISPCYQVTSGSLAALDVELLDLFTLHSVSEVVT